MAKCITCSPGMTEVCESCQRTFFSDPGMGQMASRNAFFDSAYRAAAEEAGRTAGEALLPNVLCKGIKSASWALSEDLRVQFLRMGNDAEQLRRATIEGYEKLVKNTKDETTKMLRIQRLMNYGNWVMAAATVATAITAILALK